MVIEPCGPVRVYIEIENMIESSIAAVLWCTFVDNLVLSTRLELLKPPCYSVS